MSKERGIVCCFCGKSWGYAGEEPTEELLKAAVDHEKTCPNNPYLAEIKRLRDALGVIIRNVDDGAVYATWCSTYAKEILFGKDNESNERKHN